MVERSVELARRGHGRGRSCGMLRVMKHRSPWLVLPLLLACNQRTDEELRGMMGDVAAGQVESLRAQLAERQAEQAKAEAAQEDRVKALERQLADAQVQLTGLEGLLADAKTRIEAFEKVPVKPTTPVIAGKPDPAAIYRVELGDAQTIGPDTALVTIVTFSDFQCPYCSRVSPTIEELRKDYGADLRYAFKHNPLPMHKNARAAAIAAEAAGEQGKFWEMHDKLFANSRDLTEKNFIAWARELKLDVKRFERDLASTAIGERVDRHQRQANDLGARGTPAFFINGRFLSGAQPAASFKVLIDEEKTKAEAMVAAGTSRTSVYAETIARGKTEP
jgi:protein-disulfide isomerase